MWYGGTHVLSFEQLHTQPTKPRTCPSTSIDAFCNPFVPSQIQQQKASKAMRLRLHPAVVLLLLAAAASTRCATLLEASGAPTMIHTSAELQHALDKVAHPFVVVASGEAHCQATLGDLGLINAVRAREGLELLLLSPDSSPELQARANLTSCHDMAFIKQPAAVETAGNAVHFAPTSSSDLQGFLQDLTGGVNVAFVNDFPFAVQVNWIDPTSNNEVPNARLAANQTVNFVSYRGHRFALRGEKMGTLLGACTVKGGDATFFAKRVAAASAALVDDGVETCSYPEAGFEEDKAEAQRVAEMREACHERRQGHNRDQPSWVHHFNDVPFKKTRVPPALWAEIQRWFTENRHREIQEGWPAGDCYTNAHDVPTTIVTLTDSMRTHIYEGVKPVLEEWIGGTTPLYPTSAYGIRLYHRGAVLYKHCDRLTTHAVSAIINVAQFGLKEPWPLQIHDHQGRKHTVLMQPGDMVLYESASAVHGREIALNGTAMANCFIHFKPSWWNYSYVY